MGLPGSSSRWASALLRRFLRNGLQRREGKDLLAHAQVQEGVLDLVTVLAEEVGTPGGEGEDAGLLAVVALPVVPLYAWPLEGEGRSLISVILLVHATLPPLKI